LGKSEKIREDESKARIMTMKRRENTFARQKFARLLFRTTSVKKSSKIGTESFKLYGGKANSVKENW
jgi:hypothetical protein